MATTTLTVRKARAGAQDLDWDSKGSNAESVVPTSTGAYRNIEKINAGHVPTTTVTRQKTRIGTGTPASTATTVDTSLQELYTDVALIGKPDASTVELSAGILRVKALGVGSSHIANDSVTNGKIGTAAVVGSGSGASGDNVIQAATVGTTELGADCVTGAKIADNAIDSEHYTDGSIDNEHHADASIKAAKLLDVPSHYIKADLGLTSTTAGTVLSFTTSTTIGAADMLVANIKSFGTGPTTYQGICLRTGANTVTCTVTPTQSSGTTTIDLMILKAVTA